MSRPLLIASFGCLAVALWVFNPPPRFDPSAVAGNVRVTGMDGTLLYESRPNGGTLSADGPPSHLVAKALIATEDRRFLAHFGVDPFAIVRAGLSDLRAGRVVSGASTLAMQVSRMRHQRTRRSWLAKLSEARDALRMTLWHGRAAVLREWLERAYFGRGASGIEAASRAYFGKPSSDLSLAEASFLVGLPQRPAAYGAGEDAAFARRRVVLDAMVREGYVTEAQAGAALSLPLDLLPREASPFLAPHLSVGLVLGEAARNPVSGRGAEIRTTIDPRLQRLVESIANAHVASLSARGLGTVAAIVIENRTGAVRAYLGSGDYLDEAGGGANDGVRMLRQPGSALKPFVYADALERGVLTAASMMADIETAFVDAGAAFTAQNYDRRFHGPVLARMALANSFNVPAVRLANRLDPPRILDRLNRFGITSLRQPAEHYGVGIALGNGEVSLWELAGAYAALARGGRPAEIHAWEWSLSASGDSLFRAPAAAPTAAVSPEVAAIITDILSDPAARSTAFGRGGPLEFPFPVAAKTGTSKDYRDNWAVGYTPTHTVAAWAGNFDGAPMQSLAGVEGAGTLMHAVMLEIGPGGAFDLPAAIRTETVCTVSGGRPGPFCPTTRREYFTEDHGPGEVCEVHRLLAIDHRTGLLASHDAAPTDVDSTLFAVLPEEFRPWQVAQGWPLPPPASVAPRQDEPMRIDPGLVVQYPPDGTVFQLDPVLRSSYQVIRLRSAVPNDRFGVHWLVDGERLPGADFDVAVWPLAPGRHQIQLAAFDRAGAPVRSRTVSITVLTVTRLDNAP